MGKVTALKLLSNQQITALTVYKKCCANAANLSLHLQ